MIRQLILSTLVLCRLQQMTLRIRLYMLQLGESLLWFSSKIGRSFSEHVAPSKPAKYCWQSDIMKLCIVFVCAGHLMCRLERLFRMPPTRPRPQTLHECCYRSSAVIGDCVLPYHTVASSDAEAYHA